MADKIQEVLSQAAAATLVKYDTPVMVTTHDTEKSKSPRQLADFHPTSPVAIDEFAPVTIDIPCQDETLNKKETEEILNSILPPKEWVDDSGNLWRQTVSSIPSTRADVIALEGQLNTRLRQRQARETGICPIRRELYTQCFDELIRQVTINCAERGLLLLRARDEIRMTLDSYETLYESSSAYGMRKILMSESKKSDYEKQIAEVLSGKGALEEEIKELDVKLEEVDRTYTEQRQSNEETHAEEIATLKRANQQVKQQLEILLFPKKAAALAAQ